MNLTDIVRKLESQLKNAEKFSTYYDKQAGNLRGKLEEVASIVGKQIKSVAKSAKRVSDISGISAAGRARIIAAQKKRWAAFRKKSGKSAAKKSGSRKTGRGRISAAGRARIIAAQRKRWAAFRRKQ